MLPAGRAGAQAAHHRLGAVLFAHVRVQLTCHVRPLHCKLPGAGRGQAGVDALGGCGHQGEWAFHAFGAEQPGGCGRGGGVDWEEQREFDGCFYLLKDA